MAWSLASQARAFGWSGQLGLAAVCCCPEMLGNAAPSSRSSLVRERLGGMDMEVKLAGPAPQFDAHQQTVVLERPAPSTPLVEVSVFQKY